MKLAKVLAAHKGALVKGVLMVAGYGLGHVVYDRMQRGIPLDPIELIRDNATEDDFEAVTTGAAVEEADEFDVLEEE